jgi:hypothetical protein
VKARKLARPVSPAEFETDPMNGGAWLLKIKPSSVGRWEKIVQQSDDYYDKQILHFIQPAFQKIQRTVHQILLKSTEKLNETF